MPAPHPALLWGAEWQGWPLRAADRGRGSTGPSPAGQQMRGSCSPTSMSTIRSLPTIVRIVTMPG